MTNLITNVARVAALAALLAVGAWGSAALAQAGTGYGPPVAPPGQGPCGHGNTGKDCKPDPQPTHGKDCNEHGQSGGVNEDHCLGTTPTTTTTAPTPSQGSTTTTDETSTTPATDLPSGTDSGNGSHSNGKTTAGVDGKTNAGVAGASTATPVAISAAKDGRGLIGRVGVGANLPYTGFPIWILATIGSLMLAAGLALRRIQTGMKRNER